MHGINMADTPLHEIASWDLPEAAEVVKELLAAGADVNARDDGDRTPLHRATHCGNTEAVKLLLANGANANATGANGYTLLHNAAGCVEVVKELLAAGAEGQCTG